MSTTLKTVLLLICSNTFMMFAWYAHLRNLSNKPLWIAIIVSWLIALCEYMFLVPANRLGFESHTFTLAQLKILQEIITLGMFVPFAVVYMRAPITWNFLWAGLCLVAAAFFIFR